MPLESVLIFRFILFYYRELIDIDSRQTFAQLSLFGFASFHPLMCEMCIVYLHINAYKVMKHADRVSRMKQSRLLTET